MVQEYVLPNSVFFGDYFGTEDISSYIYELGKFLILLMDPTIAAKLKCPYMQ